jgi:hypothetical protein
VAAVSLMAMTASAKPMSGLFLRHLELHSGIAHGVARPSLAGSSTQWCALSNIVAGNRKITGISHHPHRDHTAHVQVRCLRGLVFRVESWPTVMASRIMALPTTSVRFSGRSAADDPMQVVSMVGVVG